MTPIIRPLLFLDIAGVLVTQESMVTNGANRVFCQKAFRLLHRLCNETYCDIVISSTWRIGGSIGGFVSTFEREGWPDAPIIGLTPVCDGQTRGDEIAQWMRASGHEGTPYVIIDDDCNFSPSQPLVRTNFRKGLTEKEYHACRTILQAAPSYLLADCRLP